MPKGWGPITADAYNKHYAKLIAHGIKKVQAHVLATKEAEADLATRDKMAHYRKAASGPTDWKNPVFNTDFGSGDTANGF